MKRFLVPGLILLALGLGAVGGVLISGGGRSTTPLPAATLNGTPGLGCPAITRASPLPREATAEQLESQEWRNRNAALDLQMAGVNRNRAGIVFIGDSITQFYDPGLFNQFNGHRNPVNLGLWGDFTQGTLWRLANGQWGNLQPRVAVLLMGTNNTQWGGRPDDVAQGVAEIVRFIHNRSPSTKVLILGLLPRGATSSEPLRAVNNQVNAILRNCADGQNAFFLDIGHLLVNRNGDLSEQVSFDRLHLTMMGYAILSTAIEPTLRTLMGE